MTCGIAGTKIDKQANLSFYQFRFDSHVETKRIEPHFDLPLTMIFHHQNERQNNLNTSSLWTCASITAYTVTVTGTKQIKNAAVFPISI